MKKIVLIFAVMLLCCTASCKNEKEPEVITLNITQIEDDYFLAKNLELTLDTYKVYTNLDEEYCIGDSIVVSYDEMTYVEEKQYEMKAIEVEAAPDFSAVLCKKPVIYLYPEDRIEVFVQLDFRGTLTHTIPNYDDGWKVTAYPDGTIIDQDKTKYPYLFWEGEGNLILIYRKGFASAEKRQINFSERNLI